MDAFRKPGGGVGQIEFGLHDPASIINGSSSYGKADKQLSSGIPNFGQPGVFDS